MRAAVAPLDHAATARAVAAERAFLERLGGGCNVPLGAHAFEAGAELELVAFVAAPDGGALVRAERRGGDAAELGHALAEELLARGARALIAGKA